MKFRFWTPLLAGKSANFFFKSTTSELFGVVIVLLGSVNYINNVQSLKYFPLFFACVRCVLEVCACVKHLCEVCVCEV